MLYDVHGNLVNMSYDVDGETAQNLYDVYGNPLQPIEPAATLKVMSYNVGQWYNGTLTAVPTDQYETYYALQRGFMTRNDPDIVCVQEYASTFSSGHSANEVIGSLFDYSYQNNGSSYQRKIMYSQHEMNDITNANYEGYTWGYQKGRISIGGKDIWIINTHLATSSTESQKVAQARLLFDMVGELEYFIILGDFNTVCTSVNDTEYTTIMKQFIDAGYHSANCSNQHGFLDTWTESTDRTGVWCPCDHIITSSNIVMSDVMVDYSKVAVSSVNGVRIDHCPIIAELTVY